MTIAICDDSVIDCLLSKFLISEYFKKRKMTCSIITYETGAKLLSDFENGTVFDIVFMDIYVGDELGIDVAGKLRNEGYDNLLIFSTITPEYAIASYSVKANGYILKPFSGERIESVLNRVLEHYVRDYIRIKVRNSYVNIMYSDIIYIESRNNRCILHTADEEYPLYMKLDDIEQQMLDEKSLFLRCHRSYIINMDHVTAVDEQFRLDNGDSVLIRSRSRAQIKKTYIAYSQSGKVKHKK